MMWDADNVEIPRFPAVYSNSVRAVAQLVLLPPLAVTDCNAGGYIGAS